MSDAGAHQRSSPPIDGELRKEPGRWRDYLVAAGFLAPALILLGVWIVYPAIRTAGPELLRTPTDRVRRVRQLQGDLHERRIVTAIKNNAIWVGVVPALVTAIGLVFAVLDRAGAVVRSRSSTVVFMPMAISLFAAGVIWRIMDQKEPDRGAVNAVIAVATMRSSPAGVLSGALSLRRPHLPDRRAGASSSRHP